MECQIGQEIKINESCKVKVIEQEKCDGCFFLDKCKSGDRKNIKAKYGECSYMERKDEKNIIFMQLQNNSTEEADLQMKNISVYSQNTALFFTSDLHFCHDREFVWKARGFNNVQEMNDTIVNNWNSIVGENDIVYVLGDLSLGGSSNPGIQYIKKLNGNIHVIVGNHDTENRLALYSMLPNVKSIMPASYIKYDGYHFFLTHFPCLSGNIEKESLKQVTINLFGHTHSKEKFFYDLPYMYNVSVDAHECRPVSIQNIIEDLTNKIKECVNQL